MNLLDQLQIKILTCACFHRPFVIQDFIIFHALKKKEKEKHALNSAKQLTKSGLNL